MTNEPARYCWGCCVEIPLKYWGSKSTHKRRYHSNLCERNAKLPTDKLRCLLCYTVVKGTLAPIDVFGHPKCGCGNLKIWGCSALGNLSVSAGNLEAVAIWKKEGWYQYDSQ